MAHFIRSFGNLHNPVEQVLDTLCRHCAVEMSCVELARAVRSWPTMAAIHGRTRCC